MAKDDFRSDVEFSNWREIYRDPDYVVEAFTGASITFRSRYRPTNPTISGSERIEGLPKGYTVHLVGSQWIVKPPTTHYMERVFEEAYDVPFVDSNPKTAFGAVKPGTFNTPPMPLYEYSLAHYQGALKYGHYNWREDPVSISTYINAARRHIDLFVEGQKDALDTGIHNLAHAMTCLSIVIDAEWYGTLLDDRATMDIRGHDKLEEYFNASKERVTKITKDWSGHAQQLKAKLAANKEGKK